MPDFKQPIGGREAGQYQFDICRSGSGFSFINNFAPGGCDSKHSYLKATSNKWVGLIEAKDQLPMANSFEFYVENIQDSYNNIQVPLKARNSKDNSVQNNQREAKSQFKPFRIQENKLSSSQ